MRPPGHLLCLTYGGRRFVFGYGTSFSIIN